jgi:23S rRNA (cytidine2498-2'-O)-methyltransferase
MEARTVILSRIYFSADEEFLSTAADELRPHFPDAWMEPLGPDIAAFEDEGVSIAVLADTIREQRLVFPRHLFRGVAEIPVEDTSDLEAFGDLALEQWQQLPLPPKVALHVWQSGEVTLPYRNDQLRRRLQSALEDIDVDVVRGGASHILSACQVADGIILGSNGVASALSDWPGGRVSLAKPKGQISRSEFKLEEIIRTGLVEIPTSGTALDLGASPGGWTRILLNQGLQVWSVDSGALDPRLEGHPGLTYIPTLAGPFLAENTQQFDVVVNDMRMEPGLSASIMNSAVRFVPSGGLGIMTIKLPPGSPLRMIDATVAALRKEWDIQTVRQLFHNRHEVTAILRRR